MNERLAFLRAIRANPDDDTTRLVFADWLDERDDPLGEFIRVQIELDPIRDQLEDIRVRRLIQREEQIERSAGRAFGATFDCDIRLAHPEFIDYRRGLPEVLCVSLDTLLERGEALFEAYPTIRELAVFDTERRGDRLAACDILSRVETLEIADGFTEDDNQALAASPHLNSIRRFVLWGGWSSYFGESLAARLPVEWPGRIEVVWLEDGLAVGLSADECDEPIDPEISYAQSINEVAGREVAFDMRPVRRLFPLLGEVPDAETPEENLEIGIDSGRGLFFGRLPDGTQAILAVADVSWLLARFRDDGHLIGVEERLVPYTDWGAVSYDDVVARVRSDYRLTPSVLRVREFVWHGDFGIHLWPRGIVSQFLSGTGRHPRLSESDWRQRGGEICRWLRKRDFVIDWRNDYWADWRGRIHSS